MSLDAVRTHYDSSKPAVLHAFAYTQGTDIFVAPGQEQYLPHEAWHVVQQMQGRVAPTSQAMGVLINDETGLEQEAEAMGRRAATSPPDQLPLPKTARPAGRVAQLVWNDEKYQVDNSERTLHVDTREVSWGRTGGSSQYQYHKQEEKPRAVLFETIATEAGMVGLLERFRAKTDEALWDIGLTVVLNQAYIPTMVYNRSGQRSPRAQPSQAYSLEQAKQNLDRLWNQIQKAWQGPPLQIVTATWERRERENNKGGMELEVVQSTVPYSRLRRLAATNPGANAIEKALRTNHDQFWRKMGDDDMPIVNPNDSSSPEMRKLAEVEGAEQFNANMLVTFGYNLTTANTAYPIKEILTSIYRKEMELRDKIAELGAPMYPSEPTTYYRPVTPPDGEKLRSMDQAWANMEGIQVGGSGQQLEGAKLARALKELRSYRHKTFHAVMVETSAGRRNAELVALLAGWWKDGTGDPTAINEAKVEAEINRLDQSALREGEYLDKVRKNLGVELQGWQIEEIKKLVAQYRQEAAREACQRLRWTLYWSQTMEHRYQKVQLPQLT